MKQFPELCGPVVGYFMQKTLNLFWNVLCHWSVEKVGLQDIVVIVLFL